MKMKIKILKNLNILASTVEAMASGCIPIVITKVGKRNNKDGVNGFTFNDVANKQRLYLLSSMIRIWIKLDYKQ